MLIPACFDLDEDIAIVYKLWCRCTLITLFIPRVYCRLHICILLSKPRLALGERGDGIHDLPVTLQITIVRQHALLATRIKKVKVMLHKLVDRASFEQLAFQVVPVWLQDFARIKSQ